MAKPPVEHPNRATEMVYVLIRYTGASFGQRKRMEGQLSIGDPTAFDKFEEMFDQKYLQYTDSRIPLHMAAQNMVKFALAGIRYRIACQQASASRQRESQEDKLVEKAVVVLQAEKASRDVVFASQLLWSYVCLEMIHAFLILEPC
jgi:hypothetical protein